MNEVNTKYVVGVVIATLVLVVVFVIINAATNQPTGIAANVDLSGFAMCLKDKGTIFYGAYWCPHCAATKKMFGSAAHYLPYHECSTADGQGQNQECNAAGVTGYPTWVFPDKT